jgi:hypothetical protein
MIKIGLDLLCLLFSIKKTILVTSGKESMNRKVGLYRPSQGNRKSSIQELTSPIHKLEP